MIDAHWIERRLSASEQEIAELQKNQAAFLELVKQQEVTAKSFLEVTQEFGKAIHKLQFQVDELFRELNRSGLNKFNPDKE